MTRREFIGNSLVISAASAIGTAAASNAPGTQPLNASPAPADACPTGKLGRFDVSRLILGSNLLTFYIHARGLKFVNELSRHYHTEEKILETLAAAERHGVNAIMTQADERYLRILKKYRDTCGGKLQWIVSPRLTGTDEDSQTIGRLADDGVVAMYIHGNQADKFCAADKRAVIAQTLETIKLHGLPAGVGGHDLNVVRYCEKPDVGADFYVKTFHHHKYPAAPRSDELKGPYSEVPGYWCKDPVETARVMKEVRKPWIAFKVMAAGAIPPRDAFTYAFQNGADFVLAGMFDFEIEEDVRIARETLAATAHRPRSWVHGAT